MIIAKDSEKAFEKIKYPFIRKLLSKVAMIN